MNENARPARYSEDPEHQKPMSAWLIPSSSYSWAKHGISISTPLVVPSVRRTCGAWAKPTTATLRSLMWFVSPLQVVLVGVVLGVGLPGGPEVLDVVDAETPLFGRSPHRLDSHPHPYLVGVEVGDEMQERDVGAVEQHVSRYVGRLDALALERDVDDRERRH